MHRILVNFLRAAIALSFCTYTNAAHSNSNQDTDLDNNSVPRYEYLANKCAFFIEPEKTDHYACGFVSVPRNYDQNNGETFDLQIAKATRKVESDKEPLLYLANTLGARVFYPLNDKQRAQALLEGLGNMLPDRDIIIVEQRGAGLLDHYPHCTELNYLYHYRQPLAYKDYKSKRKNGLLACTKDFASSRSIELATLNFESYTKDIEAIRQAMGIGKWSVFGDGFGSTVALDLIRRYPNSIERAVIESPHLPGSDLSFSHTEYYSALERAFDACQSQSNCSSYYPNFKQQFIDNIERLNKQPAKVRIKDGAGEITVDGLKYLDVIKGVLSESRWTNTLPAIVDAIFNDNIDSVSGLFSTKEQERSVLGNSNALPYQISYACNSYNQDSKPSQPNIESELSRRLLLHLSEHQAQYSGFTDLCENLGLTEPTFDHFEAQEFNDSPPTLVITNPLNPSNTLENADTAVKLIEDAQLVQIPSNRHNSTLHNPCAINLVSHFLNGDNQRITSPCEQTTVYTLPSIASWNRHNTGNLRFITPGTWPESNGISYPSMQTLPALSQGWYASDESPSNVSLLNYRNTIDPMLDRLMRDIGLKAGSINMIETGQTINSNGLRWSIKELLLNDSIAGWLGLARANSHSAYVLYGYDGETPEHKKLYKIDKPYTSVFLTALKGFEVCGVSNDSTCLDKDETERDKSKLKLEHQNTK